jgi:hypothetical protein
VGIDNSTDEAGDDDSGNADPSMQLEMEIRGMRAGTGPAEEVNGNGTGDDNEELAKEDVEMT